MRATLVSLTIIAICTAAGVMLIAATIPAALWPTFTVAAFLIGFVLLAISAMEAALLYERFAGTFSRFAAHLKRKGVTE